MDKTYPVIYLDPAWKFMTYSGGRVPARSDKSQYPTLTIDELKALRLPMAKDCTVLMWATMPLLDKAIEVGCAWGLTYKTAAFVWVKTNKYAGAYDVEIADNVNWVMSLGYWTRSNAEMCLLFTKGNPKRIAANVRQLIVAPRGRHSEKPAETYSRIEQLVSGPYLEIFARQCRPGWDVLGNEIDGRDLREVLR